MSIIEEHVYCVLSCTQHLSLKDHKVRSLKFNFLFVVLQMMKNDKCNKNGVSNPVALSKSRHIASLEKPEECETTRRRLCEHCGSNTCS